MVFTWFMFNVFMSWGFLPLLRSQDYSDLPQLWMSISDVEYELNFVYCCLWRRRRSNDQLLQLSLASFDMSMAFPRTTTTTLGASVWSSQTSSRSGEKARPSPAGLSLHSSRGRSLPSNEWRYNRIHNFFTQSPFEGWWW